MNRFITVLKKHWITLWLVVVALLFSGVFVYAIYTRITIAKRVVSTQAGVSSLFSSDYMTARGMNTTESTSDTTQNYIVDVHIFNYIYPKEAVYRSESTQYDLTATIGTVSGEGVFSELADTSLLAGKTYSITYNNSVPSETFVFNAANGTNHTFQACEIAGGGANSNSFTLEFDKSELGETPAGLCIQLTASPYYNELPIITGLVSVKYAKQATTGWKGEVEEIDSLKSYDGYNYYIDGNGKGKITFRWKKDMVTINKSFLNNPDNVFYKKNTSDEYVQLTRPISESDLNVSDGYYSITMDVDSIVHNRYEVQFYKVDPELSYTSSNVNNYLPPTVPSDWEPETD